MRWSLLLAAVLLLGAAAWLAVGSAPPEPVRIGTNVWLGYEPLHAAAAAGRLRRDFQLVEFVSASQVVRAFESGDIDAAALTLDEALGLSASTHDVRVVAVVDSSRGADALVAKPGIATLAALAGRRVGVERTAVGALLLARALEHGGLAASSVTLVPLITTEHVRAWSRDEVDAVVTFEPALSQLRAAGAVTLFSSADIPGEIVDVLVVRRTTLRRSPRLAAELAKAWFEARDWAVAAPDAFATLAARRLHVPRAEIETQLRGLELAGRDESARLMAGPLPTLSQELVSRSTSLQRDLTVADATRLFAEAE